MDNTCTKCCDRTKAKGSNYCWKCQKIEWYELQAQNKHLEQSLAEHKAKLTALLREGTSIRNMLKNLMETGSPSKNADYIIYILGHFDEVAKQTKQLQENTK